MTYIVICIILFIAFLLIKPKIHAYFLRVKRKQQKEALAARKKREEYARLLYLQRKARRHKKD